MDKQVPISSSARADDHQHDGLYEISPDLVYQRLAIVNVAFFGLVGAGDQKWVLIDAGITGSAARIIDSAARRFGEDARPAAIIVTHGHFDHIGALEALAERWDVPVYAHELELPYLNGLEVYPPADPTVGGGVMSALSRLYPRGPIDVSPWLRTLPADGSVPGMRRWRWLHTPGHTPGHVSLWRDMDRTIIAGDAFITTAQESAFAVVTQRAEIHGPPMYYTADWVSAKLTVQRLAALSPELAVTGHGPAMRGFEIRQALQTLARDFDRVAVPDQGRYVTGERRLGESNSRDTRSER